MDKLLLRWRVTVHDRNFWLRTLLLGGAPLLALVGAQALPGGALDAVKVLLAFATLCLYPGLLLSIILWRRLAWGRMELATAFGLSMGLWLPIGGALQRLGASLWGAAAAMLVVLLALVWWAAQAVSADGGHGRERRRRQPADWLDLALFWGAVILVLGVFVTFAAIWRPTDRWTYAGIVRSLLDSGSLQPGALAPNIELNVRLDLSPWLVQIALLVQLSGVDLLQLYSLYLPPLLLVLALCAVYGLGRTLLATRWAAALGVALLALLWLADMGVPALAAFPWQERMLLRIEGNEASVGQWALLGRIVEDKFLLLFVLLPLALTWIMRYLLHGERRNFAAMLLVLAATVVVHPLGIVYTVFGVGGLLLLRLLRRVRPVRRRSLLVAGALVAGAAVPAIQTVQFSIEKAETGATPLSGQAFLDMAIRYGLWAAPWSDQVYAAHPGLLLRREWLLGAMVLLLLLAWRGWRRPGWQLLAGGMGATAAVAFNPYLGPVLAAFVTFVYLPRMAWPLLLMGSLALALAVEWGLAFVRLRRPALPLRWGAALACGGVLLLLLAWQGPTIVRGLDLLGEIRAAALPPAEQEVLRSLRSLGQPNRTVLADEWLSNELPATAGGLHPIAFRGKDSLPGGAVALREFYQEDRLDVSRLQTLAQYEIDLAVVAVGSAVDQQLAQLGPSITPIYSNAERRVYQLAPGWERGPVAAGLLQAGEALAAGQLGQAAAAAEQVLAAEPGSYTARQVLSAALAQQGEIEQALDVLAAIEEDGEKQGWLGKLRANVHRLEAALAERRGEPLVAQAAAYRAAWAADAANLDLARVLVHLNTTVGGQLLSEGETQEIIDAFAAAATPEANPLSYLRRRAFWSLGEIAELLGRAEQAEAAYRAALALGRPHDTEAEGAEQLGRFLVRQGRLQEARSLYSWALPRNYNAPALYAALADVETYVSGGSAAEAVWYAAASANPYAAWPYVELAKVQLEHSAPKTEAAATRTETAVRYLEQALALDPSNAEAYTLLAQTYLAQDDTQKGLSVWQRAVQANPQMNWARQEATTILRSQDEYASLVNLLENAVQAKPDDQPLRLELAQAQAALTAQTAARRYLDMLDDHPRAASFQVVDRSLASGWVLVGFAANQAALVAGQATPLWLFWEAPSEQMQAGSAAQGWQRIEATQWVQKVTAAANLTANGNFEKRTATGVAVGFPNDVYGANPATRQVQLVEREGESTAVAALVNGLADPRSSYASLPIGADAGQVYLQMGTMRSRGGSGYLGVRWQSEGNAGSEETYTASNQTTDDWRSVRQLLEPPPDAATLEVLLLNLNPGGSVQFDDLLLLALDTPGAAAE